MSRRTLLSAFAISSSASLILCGYEFIRSATSTLFKAAYGAHNLVIGMAVVPFAVAAVLFVYGRLLRRFGPRRTLWISTVGSGVCIVAGWAGVQLGWRPASAFLYLFREAYVVLLIEQYWSYLTSILSEPSAKRLNGAITGWASLGAIAGAWLVHVLAQPLGTPALLLLSAAVLLPGALVSDMAYARLPDPDREAKDEVAPTRDSLRLSLIGRSRILFWLFAMIIVAQIAGTALTLQFEVTLQNSIPDRDAQTAFSGAFYAWLNTAAAVLQFALAPLLLRFLPLFLILLLLPLLNFSVTLWAAWVPSLTSVGAAYLVFKAFDYSIFRATKEVLYIPLSFDARFRAKEVIDVFGYRFGKGAPSVVIAALQKVGVVFDGVYPWIATVAAAIWFAVAGMIGRARRLSSSDPAYRGPKTVISPS